MMKLLIAGGAGYLGSNLVPKLIERGYEVDVVDFFWFGNNLPPAAGVVHKDLFDLTVQDLHGYEQVIFLAGLSNDPMAEFSPGKNFIYNAAAPAYLAYIAKKARVRRYVYASSCSVYGYTENRLYDEESPAVAHFPYGISKLQGEQAVLQLGDDDFSVIALRMGTISGYSPRMRLDLIVNTMFMHALRQQLITVNNPAIWRPVLSIEDAGSAYIRAIEGGPAVGGIYNIASANYTVGEIADLVKLELEAQLGFRPRLCIRHMDDLRSYKVNIDKAANVLSFHPRDDIRAIVQHLIANMEAFKDWDNPAYYNLERFKMLETPSPRPSLAMTGAVAS
jgi:nucleoside-diphosphate-sugar epimerase